MRLVAPFRPVLLAITVVVAGLVWMNGSTPGTAQTGQGEVLTKMPAFNQAFLGWLADNGIERGMVTLRFQGDRIGTLAKGISPDKAVELASLSKAVTALCIDALIQEGALTYEDRVDALLDLPRAPYSVAQLMTHTSGLVGDMTQQIMLNHLDDPTPRWTEVAQLAADHLGAAAPEFFYTNVNYAILGAVIETVSGEDYETACRSRVLAPAGVLGQASPRTGGFLPWGGWRMTVPDYGQFFDHAFGPKGRMRAVLGDMPQAMVDGPVTYGPGVFLRPVGAGFNAWHFGALCFPDRLNTGSFAVHWQNGWTAMAWYEGCVDWPAMGALDAALRNAAFGAAKQ